MSRNLPLSDAAILCLHPHSSRLHGSAAAPELPFMFRAIIAVASPSTKENLDRRWELKRILAQSVRLVSLVVLSSVKPSHSTCLDAGVCTPASSSNRFQIEHAIYHA